MKKLFIGLLLSTLSLITINTYSQMSEYKTTASGLKYIIHSKGKGPQAKAGDKVSVHYAGKLTDGKEFDSSYKRNQPFTFNLGEGQVIKGWDEGIALLNEGDSATFEIPAELGYGSRDMGTIPANSTLIFTVELVKVFPAVKIEPFKTEGAELIELKDGLKIYLIQKGKKDAIKITDGANTTFHYTGYFEDGKIFDSSVKKGEPVRYPVGKGNLKGLDEGLQQLKVGDKARLFIPYQLAYGENGIPPQIPAKANLIFDLEILAVVPEVKPIAYDTKGKDTLNTASGLKYIIVSEGKKDAIKAIAGKKVSVHYTGYFEDGKIFDSSIQRGEPISFNLGQGQVIKGWDEGIALMKVGDKFRLLIPFSLGYGEQGYPGAIPPKANLTFDVELMGVSDN